VQRNVSSLICWKRIACVRRSRGLQVRERHARNLGRMRSVPLRLRDDGLRFDLDGVFAYETRDLEERIGGSHHAEVSAVRAGDGLPLVGVPEVDPSSDDIGERSAERSDARSDLVEDVDRLALDIVPANDFAGTVGRGRAADENAVADAYRPAVAADRLPDASAIDTPPIRPAFD